mgnify:CR=1 FL=1
MQRNRRLLVIFLSVFLIAAAISLKLVLDYAYRLPVLMYHSIDYTDDKSNRMTVSPEVFAKQIKFLSDKKYNVIPLAEAVDYIGKKTRPPAKTVAITLDDGYENNYIYAYPILKRYKIPATIFVVTDLAGKEGFMTWDQIRELSDSGLIEIGSHTVSHYWLQYLDDKLLKHELEDSKEIIETRLGREARFICYPMGSYDERVKQAARHAGYKAAFATKPTRTLPNYDIYEIKRVRISPTANNLFVFWIKVSGYHAFFRIIQNDYKDIPKIIWRKKY